MQQIVIPLQQQSKQQPQHFLRRRRRRRSAPVVFCLFSLLSIFFGVTDSFQQHGPPTQRPLISSPDINAAAFPLRHPAATARSRTALDTIGTASLSTVDASRSYCGIYEPSNDYHRMITTQQQRRRRAALLLLRMDEEEYQRRKREWADRYTTLDGLRATFGANKNKFFGDLDATTTRKLYKSLLPSAIYSELAMGVGIRPEELAPMAFEARKAAKLYARERCYVGARWLARLYDGFRQLKQHGRFQMEGMSYDQVWEKYYQRSQQQTNINRGGVEYEDLVAQTSMKILESACRTNPFVDQMTLENKRRRKTANNNKHLRPADLENIAQTLEDDVRRLLGSL